MKKVIYVQYNWFYTNDEHGEGYAEITVHSSRISGMFEIQGSQEEPYHIRVECVDGTIEKIFNPNVVTLERGSDSLQEKAKKYRELETLGESFFARSTPENLHDFGKAVASKLGLNTEP